MNEQYLVRWVGSERWEQVSANEYADIVWKLGVPYKGNPFKNFNYRFFEGRIEIVEEKPPPPRRSRILSLEP